MPYYRVCPFCGSNLDPGEVCDCQQTPRTKEKQMPVMRKPQRNMADREKCRILAARIKA